MSHFRFDPELLHVETMYLQKATVAGGGFLMCIEDGKKKKIPMNVKVCRKFGDVFYTNPIEIKVLLYGEDAIIFDRARSYDENHVEYLIEDFKNTANDKTLYYDGRLVYSLDYTIETTNLSKSGFFTHIRIPAFNPELLFASNAFSFAGYDGIMCNGIVSIPIWSEMLSTLMKFYDTKSTAPVFDAIDNVRSLNLQGLLKLCNMSAKNFGMESIECFELVSYMVEFKTVNLPRLGKKVKMTSPTGLTFSDMIAFHIGKISKCESYEQLKEIQKSITFLTSYCIVENDTLDAKNIFVKGKIIKTLPAGTYRSEEV